MHASFSIRLLTMGILCCGSATYAVTIRDDRNDSDHQVLAAQYPSVGDLLGNDGVFSFRCSGTLIDDSWVLTAAHCVDDALALTFTVGDTTYSATSWTAHSKWDGDLSKGYDIGLVQLNGQVRDVAPAVRYTGNNELGNIATMVGFGQGGTGSSGAAGPSGIKRGGENTLDRYLRTPGKTARVLLSDFDNPTNPADSSWESAVPLNRESSIAPGDSGGGLFINVAGQDQLVGVHSFTWGILDGNPNSDYGDAFGDTRVSAFNDWIDGIISGGGSGGDGGGNGGGGKNGGGGGRGRPAFEPLTGQFVAMRINVVPEPAGLGASLMGLLSLLAWSRRRC